MTPVAGMTGVLPTGLLISESILHTDGFKVLATFVALNTLMYATLALMKVLPKGYTLTWFSGRNRRAQSRSIYPDVPLAAPESPVAQVPHQRGHVAGPSSTSTDEPGSSTVPAVRASRPSDILEADVMDLVSAGLRSAARTALLPVSEVFPIGRTVKSRRVNPSPRGPRS